MPGIEDINVIDVVAHDPTTGEYMLVMVETRPWGADPKQADQLKAKINTYVNFVVDGDLARTYPETARQRIRLQVDCTQPPIGEFREIIDHAAHQVAKMDLSLVVNARG